MLAGEVFEEGVGYYAQQPVAEYGGEGELDGPLFFLYAVDDYLRCFLRLHKEGHMEFVLVGHRGSYKSGPDGDYPDVVSLSSMRRLSSSLLKPALLAL